MHIWAFPGIGTSSPILAGLPGRGHFYKMGDWSGRIICKRCFSGFI